MKSKWRKRTCDRERVSRQTIHFVFSLDSEGQVIIMAHILHIKIQKAIAKRIQLTSLFKFASAIFSGLFIFSTVIVCV